MPIYQSLGFTNHPFTKTNANEEPDLESYFVPPPYFDAVIGDSSSPSASVILAPRGAGKTALKRMVENSSIEKKFLAVTYDRFEFSAGEKIEDITLQYHLRNIITRVLISFLSYLSEHPDVIKVLTKEEKKEIGLFVKNYLGDLTGGNLQELTKELKSLPERLRKYWSDHVGILDSVLNFVLKSYELDKIDLPKLKQDERKLTGTYKYQLEILLSLVKKLGFKSIYILIDRVDETEKTGNNAEATYKLIQPLIKDLDLLGLDGYGFKFFLWDQIEPFYQKDARPDRISHNKLEWNRIKLRKILEERLKAYSDQKISSIKQLLNMELDIDIDEAICVMANSSPRNMIRFCEFILTQQGERDPDSAVIELPAIDRASVLYADTLSTESYGDDIKKSMQKVGRELFTINYVANDIMKVSGQAVRNKITAWANSGVIKQVGTIVVPPAKKPVNFYCVIDPSVVRLIHRTTTFDKFIKDRWLPCGHCNTENLLDIELYPDDNDAVCTECGKGLL